MDKACVAVLDPAVSYPAVAAYNEMAQVSVLPLTYHVPYLYGMVSLQELKQDNIAGVIVLGSNNSVNLPCDHHSQFAAWVRKFCQQQRRPVLGICYGHQLVASIFGGKVAYRYPNCKRMTGLRCVEVLEDERLAIDACQQDFVVSHNEVVATVPDGFELLARSEEVAFEGLRHRELPIWTIQAHVEATQDFLDNQGIGLTLPATVKSQGYAIVAAFLSYCAKAWSSRGKELEQSHRLAV